MAAAMVGVATSATLSASFVRLVAVSAEARTILTFAGSRCRNCSFKEGVIVCSSPKVISEKLLHPTEKLSWLAVAKLNSSPLMSCCSLCCSEAAVLLTSSALSVS